jgi:hypothetical protein
MSDNIERLHEEPLFICASVKKTDDRKPGGTFNFDKRKKKDNRKVNKVCKKPVICTGQKAVDDVLEIWHKEPDETHTEENRCGKIIDIEA